MSSGNSPEVVVAIINHNGRKLLEKYLSSVLADKYRDYQVVIVDNGSKDGSVRYVKDNYPQVKLIENDKNVGFARANNQVFEEFMHADYFALLNNDVRIDGNYLEKLVSFMEKRNKVGAVGPKMLYPFTENKKDIINSAGGIVDDHDRGFDRGDGVEDDGRFDVIEEVDFLSGGAVLLRGSAVREIGGFDDKMFFYYEDVDLCFKLREAGWKVMYNGRVSVRHEHMGTSGRWSSRRATLNSNINRIRSIARRRGIIVAAYESIRSPVEWLLLSLYAKIYGRTYRDILIERAGKSLVHGKN